MPFEKFTMASYSEWTRKGQDWEQKLGDCSLKVWSRQELMADRGGDGSNRWIRGIFGLISYRERQEGGRLPRH